MTVSFIELMNAAVICTIVNIRILHLLVLGASVSKHVNTAASLYLVLGNVVLLVSAHSTFVSLCNFILS